jgi:3-oxo-5-alpha-steroid 4-dehydrogenase 1
MVIIAFFVFIALQYFKAGYGYLRTSKWGPSINNKLGWVIMEVPVFIAMLWGFIYTKSYTNIAVSVMTALMLIHYFQRSLVFPFLMKGKSQIPVAIVAMGAVFNLSNAYMQGGWLFHFAPEGLYTIEWLKTPQFIIGTIIFIFGMVVNLHSDYIIRHLRKPGDTRHYIPKGGMFKYVSSANYFGEFTEWLGFAVLTWSYPGAIFCLWTFANLAPRAGSLYEKYTEEFGEEFTKLKRKRIIPFIY